MKSQESRVKRSQSRVARQSTEEGAFPMKNCVTHIPTGKQATCSVFARRREVPNLKKSGVELTFNSQKILDSGLCEAD